MSNEELCALAGGGDRDAMMELWRQVRRLAWKFIPRWRTAAAAGGMVDADLEQVAFIGLLRAVDAFEPGRGLKFSSYFVMSLRAEVFTASGINSERKARDPLRTAVSLDLPASPDADEELILADMLEDPQAAEAFRRAEVFGALEPFLSDLPADQKDALYRRYWLELPPGETDRKAHDAALRALRHPSRSRQLREFWHG